MSLLDEFKKEFKALGGDDDFYSRLAKERLVLSGLLVPEIREYILTLWEKNK